MVHLQQKEKVADEPFQPVRAGLSGHTSVLLVILCQLMCYLRCAVQVWL